MISNRAKDSVQEQIVNSTIFNALFKDDANAQLVFDKNMQIAGVDMTTKSANGEMKYVDFKAQSSPKYLNNPRDTFIVELSFINRRNEEMEGWFLQNNLLTTHYAFIWIPKADVDADGWLKDNNSIKQFEIMFVPKKDLQNYVFSTASKDELFNTASYMRDNYINHTYVNNLKLCCSTNYVEMPVTIVLPKTTLQKYSTLHMICTRNTANGFDNKVLKNIF